MKTIKFIAAACAAIVLAASCQSGNVKTEAQLPTKAESDSVAYLVGINFGYFIKSNGFGDKLSTSQILKGMNDFLKAEGQPGDENFGEQFKVNPDLMNELFNNYISKISAYKAEVNQKEGEAFLEKNKMKDGVVVTESGLQYIIIEEGSDVKAGPADEVEVNYKGTLINGDEFDSNNPENGPITLSLNRVIAGWTEGIQLIGEGGKIKLFVPAELGYGARGAGSMIGPNSVLIFDVELVKVHSAETEEE